MCWSGNIEASTTATYLPVLYSRGTEPNQLSNFYLELRSLAQDDPEDYAGWEGLDEASDGDGGDGGGPDTGSGSEANGNGSSNGAKKRGKKRRPGEAGLASAGGAGAGGRGTKKR